MCPFFTLFHCDTTYGNRLHEERFQWFVISREGENQILRIEPSELERIVTRAKEEPSNSSVAVLTLTNVLVTSLGREAYDMYVEDVGVLLRVIFFDEFLTAPDGVSVDYEATKNIHHRKYRFFKFATFLDLVHPDHIHWRGQAESESVRLIQRGLDHFEKADLQRKIAILARWIRQPGPSAFSATREIRTRKIRERRTVLLKLEHLTARETAQRLDAEGIKPSRRYASHTEHFQRNPNSFQAWLSKERSEARKATKSTSR